MAAAQGYAAAAFLALAVALVPARAQEAVRPPHAIESPHASPHENPHESPHAREGSHESPRACLNQKERRAAVESGAVIHLGAAMHAVRSRMPGTLVRARLCRGHQGHPGLVYVLTVLAHDGKVARLVVDAVKGTLVGER